MRTSKNDLLTPANGLSTIGLVLTVAGSFSLNTLSGLAMVAIGRLCDVLDGPLARATHASRTGAIIDVTMDKVAGLAILLATFYYQLAPAIFILFVFCQHAIVAAVSVLAELKKRPLSSSSAGKHNMFLHVVTLLTYALEKHVGGSAGQLIYVVATVLAILSVYSGIKVTYEYYGLFSKSVPGRL